MTAPTPPRPDESQKSAAPSLAAIEHRLAAVTEDDAYALPWTFGETCREGAAEITTLRAEVSRLTDALAAETERAEAEMRTLGVIEIAVRNPDVASYMAHWEGRTEKAEREVAMMRAALARKEAEAEVIREEAMGFIAVAVAQYAATAGLPDGHLHPMHYDTLARFGARMDSFTRHEESPRDGQ